MFINSYEEYLSTIADRIKRTSGHKAWVHCGKGNSNKAETDRLILKLESLGYCVTEKLNTYGVKVIVATW